MISGFIVKQFEMPNCHLKLVDLGPSSKWPTRGQIRGQKNRKRLLSDSKEWEGTGKL